MAERNCNVRLPPARKLIFPGKSAAGVSPRGKDTQDGRGRGEYSRWQSASPPGSHLCRTEGVRSFSGACRDAVNKNLITWPARGGAAHLRRSHGGWGGAARSRTVFARASPMSCRQHPCQQRSAATAVNRTVGRRQRPRLVCALRAITEIIFHRPLSTHMP